MPLLVPDWLVGYAEFWQMLRAGNLHFIRLRYFIVFLLYMTVPLAEHISDVLFTPQQESVILLMASFLLIMNIVYQRLVRITGSLPEHFNILHISLFQMTFDLIALFILVYFSGGVESPIRWMFIFHMVIGSMILPGWIVYTMAFSVAILFTLFAGLEFYGIIPHIPLGGFFHEAIYQNEIYVAVSAFFVSFGSIVSVIISNEIARRLYNIKKQLLASLDTITRFEDEKQRYTMTIVHEIKRPLTAVSTYLHIVRKESVTLLPNEMQHQLERAQLRCDEAFGLINSVLQISEAQLSTIQNKSEMDLIAVINDSFEKLRDMAERKNINYTYTNIASDTVLINAVPQLMLFVFTNIIGNALKYTPENGSVAISLRQKENNFIFSVIDTGIGIPPHELNKVGTNFFRGSNAKKNGIEGTGLGLSAVRSILASIGANVLLKSPANEENTEYPGTIVLVTIPL